VNYTLTGAIRKACIHIAEHERDRAKALIDEALDLIDGSLLKRSRRGRPKALLQEVRCHVAEAGFAVVSGDFGWASEMLDEARRVLVSEWTGKTGSRQ